MDEGNIEPPSSSNNKRLTEDREGFVSGVENNIPGWSVEASGSPAWPDSYGAELQCSIPRTTEINKITQLFWSRVLAGSICVVRVRSRTSKGITDLEFPLDSFSESSLLLRPTTKG